MRATVDGNEAAASVAYRLNEVCCIYPITPSSPMAELCDEWASAGQPNVWGTVPSVVEMQSEGGAAGALHGALQSGALATTFTASQGLLLMIPNMYKIAGELTPAVLHVAARSLAAQGLSIFGDHSDVMAVRQTGFALLASASVQEAHDLALVAQAATLQTRVPFVHFFDGFRTSHELNTIELLTDDDLRALVPEELVRAHRGRALSPERPFIRGTAQNPDVYFQARETVNPFYARVPDVVEDAMARLAERTGRRYHVVDYNGHPEAERVLVVMGSGGETVQETVAALNARGERVGVVQVRLYRPFPAQALLDALPATVRTRRRPRPDEGARLDRRAALPRHGRGADRIVRGRRAGGDAEGRSAAATACPRRSSRRAWSPACSTSWRASSRGAGSRSASETTSPARAWTTTRRSTSSRPTRCARSSSASARTEPSARTRTRSRSSEPRRACTRRATSSTTRRSPARRPSRTCASGRSRSARRISCSRRASSAATSSGCSTGPTCSAARRTARRCCSTARAPPDEVWDALSRPIQEQILAKHIDVYVIDAGRIAREVGLAGRINIILQTCFFAVSGVLPREQAIEPDQGRGRQDLRPARRRGGRAQPGRGRPRAGRPAPGRGARAGRRRAAGCRRSCPRTRPSSSAPSPRRCWPAGATTCRSARCRWTAPIRAARRPTRSATSRSSSRSGTPTSASSAATAASSARTA